MTEQSSASALVLSDSLSEPPKGPKGSHWASDVTLEEAFRSSGVPPGALAPSSFKADTRSRQLKSSESLSRASPSKESRDMGQKIQLPPIRALSAAAAVAQSSSAEAPLFISQTAEYQTSHHILIPKKRGPSAYARRHHMTHHQAPMAPIEGFVAEGGAAPAHVQNALVRALAMNAELRPGRASDDKTEAMQNQWRNASVVDLETLDSILDQLVVTDVRMREALLAGPPISFETVIHDQRLPSGPQAAADGDPDKTFMTSVGMEGMIDGEMKDQDEQEPSSSAPIVPLASDRYPSPRAMPAALPQGPVRSQGPGHTALSLVGGSWPVGDDEDMSREKIPIPILPNLTRMYVTTRQSNAAKSTPPLPPPTADYLLNHRPSIAAAAPSYDELCDQIKGVQRQYTCGSSKAESSGRNPSPGRSNLDMYISGLDGPSLDQMVLYEDSINVERSRPTFVAMKKNPQGAKLRTKGGREVGKKTESVGPRGGNIEVVGGGGGGDE